MPKWLDLTPDFWVPERKGDELTGVVLYPFEYQTTIGRAHAVVLQKVDPETGELTDEQIAVTAGAMLSRLLDPDLQGKMVRLVYQGEGTARSTGLKYKKWRIQVAADDVSAEEMAKLVGDMPVEEAAGQEDTPF